MESKGKFKVAQSTYGEVYTYEILGDEVKVQFFSDYYNSDSTVRSVMHPLSLFKEFVDEGSWIIISPLQIGDTVVCNPNNSRVIKDRTNHEDGGWTPQYQDWLNGKHAVIVEISYSQIYAGMGLSYKLDVVGHDHSFYIQDPDEMIPYVAPTLNVNREEFNEALRQEFLKQMEEDDKLAEEFNKGPIKSDGGSSDYYKIPLPQNVIDKIVETGCIQVEDVIKYTFGNDFDFGNLFKAQVRLFGSLNGKGKAGNTPQYEYNKMEYTLTKKINNRLEESN